MPESNTPKTNLKTVILESYALKRIDTKEKILNIFRNTKNNIFKIDFSKYIKLFFCKKSSKKDQEEYKMFSESIDIIKNCFDVNQYIYMIYELENIKKIIFDKTQLNLFNCIPFEDIKRSIHVDILRSDNNKISDFRKIISDVMKRNSNTDNRLLKMLDQKVLKILLDNEV